jgi:hypothetical protein
MVAKIATGEAEEATGKAPARAKGGKVGGKARASVFSPAERSEFARCTQGRRSAPSATATPVHMGVSRERHRGPLSGRLAAL